jgi:magnesium chelatase subunit I
LAEVVTAFEEGVVAHVGEDIASTELLAILESIPALAGPVATLTSGEKNPAVVASAVEFVLEGLHLTRRLNKDASGNSSTYRSRMK